MLRILLGKFTSCGQSGVAIDYLYVHQSVYDKFKALLLEKLNEGYSYPHEEDGNYGKIINQQ